jgi:hypothetical protein
LRSLRRGEYGVVAGLSAEGGMRFDPKTKNRPLMPVELLCRVDGLPMPEPEFRFEPSRRWRFDWAWISHQVALEIEGGVFTRGRHTRPKGFLGDLEKYNRATQLGWKVFRCTPSSIHLGMQLVKDALLATLEQDRRATR